MNIYITLLIINLDSKEDYIYSYNSEIIHKCKEA